MSSGTTIERVGVGRRRYVRAGRDTRRVHHRQGGRGDRQKKEGTRGRGKIAAALLDDAKPHTPHQQRPTVDCTVSRDQAARGRPTAKRQLGAAIPWSSPSIACVQLIVESTPSWVDTFSNLQIHGCYDQNQTGAPLGIRRKKSPEDMRR